MDQMNAPEEPSEFSEREPISEHKFASQDVLLRPPDGGGFPPSTLQIQGAAPGPWKAQWPLIDVAGRGKCVPGATLEQRQTSGLTYG